MVKLERTGSKWDRTNRNGLNTNWQTIEDTLSFIEGGNFAPNSIGATQLKNASVGTAQLADGAVKQSKLANDSVGASQLRNASVGRSQLANNGVNNSKVEVNTLHLDRLDTQVHCIRRDKEILVIVPSVKNYVGYSIKRKTVPFQEGTAGSNMDVWSIDRVSGYTRDGNTFTENPALVYVYTHHTFSTPMTTQDTIFRREGESDYSGGNQHGDEKVQNFDLIVGNARMSSSNFTRSGESVEFVQETFIYPDSRTHGANTQPYLKVNKSYQFNAETGYTLRQSVEFLEETTIDFACMGSLIMRRMHGDDSGNNITNVVALDNAKHFDVSSADSGGNHLSGDNESKYKIIGYFKEVMLEFKTDSDYSDFYFRNWASTDVKFYGMVIPQGETVPKGHKIKSSLNYHFKSLN